MPQKKKSPKKGKVVPLRQGLYRPQGDEPIAGFGFEIDSDDDVTMIIRNPDGSIERMKPVEDG